MNDRQCPGEQYDSPSLLLFSHKKQRPRRCRQRGKNEDEPPAKTYCHHPPWLTNDGKHLRTETGDDEPRCHVAVGDVATKRRAMTKTRHSSSFCNLGHQAGAGYIWEWWSFVGLRKITDSTTLPSLQDVNRQISPPSPTQIKHTPATTSPRPHPPLSLSISPPILLVFPQATTILKANIYRFGASSSTPPFLRDVEWTVNDGEAWAVVSSLRGGSGKSVSFETLLGNNRILPSPLSPGLYPFLNELDPFDGRQLGLFALRNTGTRGAGGGFHDYTARYGTVLEEDGRTLRESLSFSDGEE
ncbi:hypothetical protein K443DRAFT_14390 [Laccaria amethystina LaAM-08-1]|uniref:Uncharacterized protein n=1 Tax=Laccaria amethystina LaAM-08-1 TaxID=1095629 RepID=A0A0C9WMV3_9AGAR|nr:hypothetical protein K443DRAFT_14390 [Laccaria amethystina LaAM-08-1]